MDNHKEIAKKSKHTAIDQIDIYALLSPSPDYNHVLSLNIKLSVLYTALCDVSAFGSPKLR